MKPYNRFVLKIKWLVSLWWGTLLVNRLTLLSSRNHCPWFSPSQIPNTLRTGYKPAQNLSSDFVEWTCALVIATKKWWPLHLLNNYWWGLENVEIKRRIGQNGLCLASTFKSSFHSRMIVFSVGFYRHKGKISFEPSLFL